MFALVALLLALAAGASLEDVYRLVRQKRLAEAVDLLEALPEKSGENWMLLGDLRASPGHARHAFQSAFSAYMEAATRLQNMPPRRAHALLWAGICCRRGEKDFAQSLALIRESVALHPTRDARNHLAVSLQLIGHEEEALSLLMANIRSGQPMAIDYSRIADSFSRVRDFEYCLKSVLPCLEDTLACEYPNDGGALKKQMLVLALHSALVTNHPARERLQNLFGNGAAQANMLSQFASKAEKNWETLRDRFGGSESLWQARLRAIYNRPEEEAAVLQGAHGFHECHSHVAKFDFPLPCYAEQRKRLTQDIQLMYQNSSAMFENVEPFRCLSNPLFSASDCRFVAKVQAIRSKSTDTRPLFQRGDFLSDSGRLTLGVFSGDWNPTHPMRRLVTSFLQSYPREEVRLLLFYRSGRAAELEKAKRFVDGIYSLETLSASEAAAKIRSFRVHVLIDTSGKTSESITLAGHSPAPIIFAWAGFPGTTGGPGVHYMVTDRYSVPPELSHTLLSEKPCYVPGSWLFTDHATHYRDTFDRTLRTNPQRRAEIRQKYNVSADAFVIGNWNRPSKMTPDVLGVVAEILRRSNCSHAVFFSVLHGNEFTETNFRNQVKYWTESLNMSRTSFVTTATLDQGEHLNVLSAVVDVVVDCTLYNGGITTADALFAGVPVISSSVEGVKMMQRTGGSLLRAVGVPELIAADYEQMVQIGTKLALDEKFRASVEVRIAQARDNPTRDQVLFTPQVGTRAICKCVMAAWQRFLRARAPETLFADSAWYARQETGIVLEEDIVF